MSASPTGLSGLQLSRRRLILGASAIGVVGTISACTTEAGPGPSPAPAPTATVTRDPDADRREAAAEAADALVEAYDATISAHPTLAPLLVPLRADHRAHLAAVEPASATTVSTTVPATGAPPGSGTAPPAVPADPVQARAALAVAETAAADAAHADAVTADDPAFARLLASMTASRVLHATILRGNVRRGSTTSPSPESGTSPPVLPPSLGPTTTPIVTGAVQPDAVDALQQVLAGEHAVVWAYGALGPRLADPETERALTLLVLHQRRRDAVRAQLVGAGAQPVVAEPAYDLPIDPLDPASAAELAALVEERLAAVYGDLVAASDASDLRTQGVTGLVDSAVRALSWAPIGTTFPGLPERANEP